MTDPIILTTLGQLPVSVYGLILAAGVGLGCLWMFLNTRHAGLPADTVVRFALWAIPLGLIGGRLLFVALRWSLIVNELGWEQIFRVWDGGFALFGVVPGCLLAALFCAHRMHISAADLLDTAAPGAALALAFARFAEFFTLQGIGRPVDTAAFQWFPLAIRDGYGDWLLPVFFWEGIAALIIAWLAARALRGKQRRPYDAVCVFLLGLGVTQVLLESLRTDDILRLGLVKVSQLAAMVCVLAVAVRWIVPAIHAKCASLRIGLCGAGILIGVGLCVGIEFGLDKSTIPNIILYLVMALVLAGIAALVGRLRRMTEAKIVNE